MSLNQSRADRSDSSQYRKAGRSGNFSQRNNKYSGSIGKDGDYAAPPPSSNLQPNRRKKSNYAPVGQSGKSGYSAIPNLDSNSNSSNRPAPNGSHLQPSVLATGTVVKKTTEPPVQRSDQVVQKASPSQTANVNPDLAPHASPTKGDPSKSFPIQFGSINLWDPSNSIPIQFGSISPGALSTMQLSRCNQPQGRIRLENASDPKSNQNVPQLQPVSSVPSPTSPTLVMHKTERRYQEGKITDEEQAKQRLLKGILSKLTPQNTEKLIEQVKGVNIDNAGILSVVVSQIFEKALLEPTFCEMYANFCYHLAGELPDFTEDNEKITFKRLLLNKCQEEFERGEREQEEANRADVEGEDEQSPQEREEKRIQTRRRMLGNIRLIGELYKKRMLTERIMHECIKKLLGQYQNPDEDDIEALCELMSTIGEMIDHPKAKEHMDAYFDMMSRLSNNMKLSSWIRSMLKDAIDLRKNKWQQRRKVKGPKMQAKQRLLKGILSKLTPQNFGKRIEQVKGVNIDNAGVLFVVVSQIFEKAISEPTFCEMYANFCYHLAGVYPDFIEDNERITFKKLLLNKCQEEFERREREQEEASRADVEGEDKQSPPEREEKRLQTRRRRLGNIRFIGELYKKRMLAERVMHECIKELLGEYQNPDEENITGLCKLMSTIGETIDHPRAKEKMDAYFDMMSRLSNNMKLSSSVRSMLKDAIDLRKNKWQQRRKVKGPKKSDKVHRDAAQDLQGQAARLVQEGPGSNLYGRNRQPVDHSSRVTSMLSPNSQMGGYRGSQSHPRGYGVQDARIDDRHSFRSKTLSVQRHLGEESITWVPRVVVSLQL